MTSWSPCSSKVSVLKWAEVIAAHRITAVTCSISASCWSRLPGLSPYTLSNVLPTRAALEQVTKGWDSLLPVLLSVGVCYENRQRGIVVEPRIFRMSSGGISFQRAGLSIKWPVMNEIVVNVSAIRASPGLQIPNKKKAPSPPEICWCIFKNFFLSFQFFPELQITRKKQRRGQDLAFIRIQFNGNYEYSALSTLLNLWASVFFPVKGGCCLPCRLTAFPEQDFKSLLMILRADVPKGPASKSPVPIKQDKLI